AFDGGEDLLADDLHRAFKDAPGDALLFPGLSFLEFAVCKQARQFGAGASAARRTIVSFARAEDKIFALRTRLLRRAEKFDVIDFLAIAPAMAILFERCSN